MDMYLKEHSYLSLTRARLGCSTGVHIRALEVKALPDRYASVLTCLSTGRDTLNMRYKLDS